MLERARIAGVSKTGYVSATPRCPRWRRGWPEVRTNDDASDSDPKAPCRRAAGRRCGDGGSSRPPAGVLVVDRRFVQRRCASWCARWSAPQHRVAGIWPSRVRP